MNSCAPARRAAAMTRSIGMAGSASAILSRTERLNSTFSCRTTPTWRRSQAGSAMARSIPSTSTRPNVEALDQLGERALARARWSDDADHLPGGYVEADIVQDFLAIDAIAEGNVVEPDVAADRR